MKYLIINGSAHKGNTWNLAMVVKNSFKEYDNNAIFKEIHLLKEEIPFCNGCSLCFRKGKEFCPHYKKMQPLVDAIDEADGILVVSTTYGMKETALLKNFMDHLEYMMHRPYFFKKKALVITTAGGVGARSAAKSIAAELYGFGFNKCYLLSVASFSWNAYVPGKTMIMKCDKISKKFTKDVMSGNPITVRYALMIPFNLFRGMSLAYVKGTEYEMEDGNYYTGADVKNHFYGKGVPIPIGGKLLGSVFYWIGKTASKFSIITYKK